MVRRWLKWLNPLNHVGISITGKVISSYGLCRFYCRHLVLLLISLLRISVDCTIVFPPPSIAIGIVSIYQFCLEGVEGGVTTTPRVLFGMTQNIEEPELASTLLAPKYVKMNSFLLYGRDYTVLQETNDDQ